MNGYRSAGTLKVNDVYGRGTSVVVEAFVELNKLTFDDEVGFDDVDRNVRWTLDDVVGWNVPFADLRGD